MIIPSILAVLVILSVHSYFGKNIVNHIHGGIPRYAMKHFGVDDERMDMIYFIAVCNKTTKEIILLPTHYKEFQQKPF